MLVLVIIICLILGVLYYWSSKQKRKKVQVDLRQDITPIIKDFVPFFYSLNDLEKEDFLNRIASFIDRHSIEGINYKPELKEKVLVAASLVKMLFKLNINLDHLIHSIYLSKGAFEGMIYGLPRKATGFVRQKNQTFDVYLSKDFLIQGFANLKDNKNVGVHEFAHIIDGMDGEVDGMPFNFMDEHKEKEWKSLCRKYKNKIAGNATEMDKYATQNKAEFFAVVSEFFFENPFQLNDLYPDLYQFFVGVYKNDLSQSYLDNFKKES